MSDRKKILYIDDRASLSVQVLASIKDEFDVVIVESPENAVRALTDRSAYQPDCLIIDLYMPGTLPSELEEYAKGKGRDLLQGQLLTIWMRDRKLKIPYAYISSVPSRFDPSIEPENSQFKGIIDKASIRFLPRNINKTIIDIFGFHTT